MDFVKRVLIRFQSEEASDCSPGRVLSHGAGQTEPPAEPPGEPAPAAPAVSPRPLGTERAQCSEAHRWEFKWGQDHWETCWKVKPGQQTAPFCLAAALEPGPERNDYKLAVVWVYSASFLIFKCLVLGKTPNLTLLHSCVAYLEFARKCSFTWPRFLMI